eukprot:221483_1
MAPSLSPVARSLYRTLYRQALIHEKKPCCKVSLHNLNRPYEGVSSEYLNLRTKIYNQFFQDGLFYHPTVSLTNLVSESFRDRDARFSIETRTSLGFDVSRALAKNLSGLGKLKFKSVTPLSPEFKPYSAIHPEPARDLPEFEPGSTSNTSPVACGSLLVAHPMLFEGIFRKSVVLMCGTLEQSDMPIGLTVNMDSTVWDSSEHKLGVYISATNPSVESSFFEEAFVNKALVSQGGPVFEPFKVWMLHPYSNLPKSRKLLEGVYLDGNINDAIELVKTGEGDARNFRFFIGHSRWGESQLRREIHENSWFVVPEPHDLVSRFVMEECVSESDNSDSSGSIIADSVARRWRNILRRMGGEYVDFAAWWKVQQM